MRALALLLATSAVLVGCNEPFNLATAPSAVTASPPMGDVSGNWVGNLQWTVPGQNRSGAAVSMTLRQSGNELSGIWSSGAKVGGQVSGRLAGHGYDLKFGGEVTWDNADIEPNCFVLATVQGTATKDGLVWTANSIGMTGGCPPAINEVVWKLARPRVNTFSTP